MGCSNQIRGEKSARSGEGCSWGGEGEPKADVTQKKKFATYSLSFFLKGMQPFPLPSILLDLGVRDRHQGKVKGLGHLQEGKGSDDQGRGKDGESPSDGKKS